MMPEYTGCSNKNELGVHVVKSDFTAHISEARTSLKTRLLLNTFSDSLTLIVNDETEYALAAELGIKGSGRLLMQNL